MAMTADMLDATISPDEFVALFPDVFNGMAFCGEDINSDTSQIKSSNIPNPMFKMPKIVIERGRRRIRQLRSQIVPFKVKVASKFARDGARAWCIFV